VGFYDLSQTGYKLKREGVRIKSITGTKGQMTLIRLDPGFESDHGHPEEQIGIVLSGQVRLTIEGETKTCREGDGYLIPPKARHSFKVTSAEHAELLEIFCPPKEENDL
jgi:quercetin dioxygenase-like cupin family protein